MSNLRRTPLPVDPAICPSCTELIFVQGISTSPDALRVVTPHPDRVTPYIDCEASARVIRGGQLVDD